MVRSILENSKIVDGEVVKEKVKADFTIIKGVFSSSFIFYDLPDSFSKNPFGIQIQKKWNGQQQQHKKANKP